MTFATCLLVVVGICILLSTLLYTSERNLNRVEYELTETKEQLKKASDAYSRFVMQNAKPAPVKSGSLDPSKLEKDNYSLIKQLHDVRATNRKLAGECEALREKQKSSNPESESVVQWRRAYLELSKRHGEVITKHQELEKEIQELRKPKEEKQEKAKNESTSFNPVLDYWRRARKAEDLLKEERQRVDASAARIKELEEENKKLEDRITVCQESTDAMAQHIKDLEKVRGRRSVEDEALIKDIEKQAYEAIDKYNIAITDYHNMRRDRDEWKKGCEEAQEKYKESEYRCESLAATVTDLKYRQDQIRENRNYWQRQYDDQVAKRIDVENELEEVKGVKVAAIKTTSDDEIPQVAINTHGEVDRPNKKLQDEEIEDVRLTINELRDAQFLAAYKRCADRTEQDQKEEDRVRQQQAKLNWITATRIG